MITYLSPKCLKSVGKMKKTDFFHQNQESDNPGQKSLGQHCNMHIFPSFLGSLLQQCIIFEIFLQFSLPPPYTMLNLGKKFWIHVSNIVCGVKGGVGGLDLCELKNAPEKQKCPKTFVHDCRYLSERYCQSILCFKHILHNLLSI